MFIKFSFQQSSQPRINNTIICSNHPAINRLSGAQCLSEAYTGQFCLKQLTTSQTCNIGPNERVMVNVSGQQQQIERDFAIFLNVLCEVIGILDKLYYIIHPKFKNLHCYAFSLLLLFVCVYSKFLPRMPRCCGALHVSVCVPFM